MSILSLFGIASAYAADTASAATQTTPQGSFLSVLPMLIIFVLVFYFMLVRPQSKRAKEHRQLLDSIAVGDEVITNGGIIGQVSKLRDNYVVIIVAKDFEITLQKAAIASVLPKGTMESIA